MRYYIVPGDGGCEYAVVEKRTDDKKTEVMFIPLLIKLRKINHKYMSFTIVYQYSRCIKDVQIIIFIMLGIQFRMSFKETNAKYLSSKTV